MKNLLIPTDLNPITQNTLKYAISLCIKSNMKLFIYIANSANTQFTNEYATKYIKNIYGELNQKFEITQTEILIEDTFFSNAQLKEVTDKLNIDLVIIGLKQQSLKTTFFESHVSDLIDELNCPVLSIPQSYIDTNIERIGYATELYDISERIKEIVPFAKLLGASIEAFHVYPVFPQNIDIEKYDMKNSLDVLRNELNFEKINLHYIKTLFDNETVSGIREFLKIYKPDILIMYHKPRGIFDKLVMDGGSTNVIVKASPVPLLALNQKTVGRIS